MLITHKSSHLREREVRQTQIYTALFNDESEK